MRETHVNSINPNTYVDLRGVTVNHPNGGETVIGIDFITGEQEVPTDETLSETQICDLCGIQFDKKKDIAKTVGKKTLCSKCIDLPGHKR